MTRIARRARRRRLGAVALSAVTLGLFAPDASAHVEISPATAVQGEAASVTFRVHGDRPGAHTTAVRVDLPDQPAIAEVYPMSVPDWIPATEVRTSPDKLPGIHGSGLTFATSAVVWTRAADAPPGSGTEELRLELGPMPSVPELVFEVTQTYSDGVVQRWRGRPPAGPGPGTVLTLTPAPAGRHQDAGASSHAHHGTAGDTASADALAPQPVTRTSLGAGPHADPPAQSTGAWSWLRTAGPAALLLAMAALLLRIGRSPSEARGSQDGQVRATGT